MSTTIGDLVDRTFREYLEPMDDLVSYTTLTSGINATVTSITFNGDLLSVEEEDVSVEEEGTFNIPENRNFFKIACEEVNLVNTTLK